MRALQNKKDKKKNEKKNTNGQDERTSLLIAQENIFQWDQKPNGQNVYIARFSVPILIDVYFG